MSDGIPEFIDPAEDCPWRSPREILARSGYAPLPPVGLDARQLPGRLWELLYAAAARRFFICSTEPEEALAPEREFSNEELAIALLSTALRYDPHSIRCGGAMLSAHGNDPR